MRLLTKFVFLSGLLLSSANSQEDAANYPIARKLFAKTDRTNKGFHHELAFPSMKNRPVTKMLSDIRRKKKRSMIPSTSLVFRHLAKKGQFKMMPSVAKNLFRSKTRSSPKKGLLSRRLEPDWADAYQETVDAIVELFIGMLDDAGWNSTVLISPEEYCYSEQQISEPEACEETIWAILDLVKNVAYHPWVVVDIFFFIAYNISLLPLEYIFDWKNLREFLHSIPKDFIYNDALLPLFRLFWEEVGRHVLPEALPVLLETFYMEFEPSGLLDEGSVEFVKLLSYFFTGDPDEIPKETLNEIHSEVCYALTLETVSMEITGKVTADDFDITIEVTDIPFCAYSEYIDEKHGEELFSMEGSNEDMQCVVSGGFAEKANGGNEAEIPSDHFFVRSKDGKTVTQPCSWLRLLPVDKREKFCANDSAPNGLQVASEACPSSCCLVKEKPTNIFLVRKEDGQNGEKVPVVQTCEWLSEKGKVPNKKICAKNKVFGDVFSPAYVSCPETCGICFEGEIA